MSNYLSGIAELKRSRGGRTSSSSHRKSYEQAQQFAGLKDDVNRYDLLLLVKRSGKCCGFTPCMIALLDYYMAFTRECDWEEGSSPIMYQSISKTALDMGVSERQVQRLEQSLFKAGALTWHDSGNHRRYGKRCEQTGRILYAYGVDLTPLAYLKSKLQEKLQEKQLYDQAWLETKRQISYYRGKVRSIMCEIKLLVLEGQGDYADTLIDLQCKYEAIAIQIRTHLGLERIRNLLGEHKALYQETLGVLDELDVVYNVANNSQETQQKSPKNDTNDVHYNSTIKKQSDKSDTSRAHAQSFQKSRGGLYERQEQTIVKDQSRGDVKKEEAFTEEEKLILQTGLQHITLKQALNVSSERFREHMPIENQPMGWNDFVESAYRLKSRLSISQNSWANACALLGRSGAAICVLLTDKAQQREHKPVLKSGAYFNAMINRAKEGELHLHNSIFGILEKENAQDVA